MRRSMAIENKLGLASSAGLAREEERISTKKAVELFENGILDKLLLRRITTFKTGDLQDCAYCCLW